MSFFHMRTGKRASPLSLETMHSLECDACPLKLGKAKTKSMKPYGSVTADLYVLGEAPEKDDDDRGIPFSSKNGQLLRRCLPDKSQVRINNIVRTRTPNDRAAAYTEIECCRPSIVADIQKVKPKALIVLGYTALKWVMGTAAPGMFDMQGRKFRADIGGVKLWVYPTITPAMVIKRGGIKTLTGVCFVNDIKRAVRELPKLTPPNVYTEEDLLQNVVPVKNKFDAVMESLDDFVRTVKEAEETVVGIDIETASKESTKPRRLRPYGKGAHIVCVGLSYADKSICVPIHHSEVKFSDKQKKQIKRRILNMIIKDLSDVTFVAHNLVFELEWLSVLLDTSILKQRNFGCSMAQAYVLDCRMGISLQACSTMSLGLDVKKMSNVSMDHMLTEPLSEILRYCALDAKVCRLLFLHQEAEIKRKNLMDVYQSQVDRAWAIACVQVFGGLPIDSDTVKQKNNLFTKDKKLLTKQIRDIKEVKKFEKITGTKFNPDSSPHCHQVLKALLPPSDGTSTAKPILENVDHLLAKEIITFRSMSKMQGTYIESLLPGGKYLWEGNIIRPTFDTMTTATRRLSSKNPNAQNYPKRQFGHLRDMIVAPKGHLMASVDYAQIEVRVLAMASQDETLIKFIVDGYDFHSEWAEQIDKISRGDWIGRLEEPSVRRYFAKNKLVFPMFYGAYPPSIARNLGMKQNQIETLTKKFWSMFPGVRNWQQVVRKDYIRKGYIELLTGFRCYGILSDNQLFNYPVQGSASDLVVDAMIRLCELAMKTKQKKFCPIINIHDDLTFYLPKKTIKKDLKVISKVMRKSEYSFTKGVPIDVDISVGKSWGSLKDYE